MRYFLDAEFNGFQGSLISLALVPEFVQAAGFYTALSCEDPTEWVRDHVLPVLQTEPVTRSEATAQLAVYFKGDAAPVVVADWPEDIAHLLLLMVTGPGSRLPMPTVRFHPLDLPLFDSQALSRIRHNTLSDASALKANVIAKERSSYGWCSTPIGIDQPHKDDKIARHTVTLTGAERQRAQP